MEEDVFLGLHTVPGGKSIISEGDMAAGGLGSKLRDHIFSHRCEGEVGTVSGEATNSKPDPVSCSFQQGCTSQRFPQHLSKQHQLREFKCLSTRAPTWLTKAMVSAVSAHVITLIL